MNKTIIADALYAASDQHIRSCCDDADTYAIAYGKGVVVGTISAVMANAKNQSLAHAITVIEAAINYNYTIYADCVPLPWLDAFVRNGLVQVPDRKKK
jgi:hypothetical protein